MCSHAPVVRLKKPGLLHSIQQSNSTHGCLVGKELVIPPHPFICSLLFCPHPFFPHHKHLHSVCFSKPSVFPGHRVTSKTSISFFFAKDTGENTDSAANSTGGVCARAKASRSRKIKCGPVKTRLAFPSPGSPGHPAGDRSESSPAPSNSLEEKKEMNSGNLMDSINQQVSNGKTQARMRSRVDWIHRVMNTGGRNSGLLLLIGHNSNVSH